jgi:hypothetical protein
VREQGIPPLDVEILTNEQKQAWERARREVINRDRRVNMAVLSRAAPEQFKRNLLDMVCAQNDLYRQFQAMHKAEAFMADYQEKKTAELRAKHRHNKKRG